MMSKDPSQSINELKHLIEKYNEAVFELRRQIKERTADDEDVKQASAKDEAYVHHLIHEVHAELIHLEEIHHKAAESEAEKQNHFFNHHTEVLAHANAHWFHARWHLELLFELALEEEVEELLLPQHRMKHLIEKIEREQYELIETLHRAPLHPHPEPPHPKDEADDKET